MSKNIPYIAFTDYHVDPILDGEKFLTVRYDWGEIESGDRVELVDGDRETFGKALVTFTTELTMQQFVDLNPDGHASYYNVEEMINKMGIFYPNANLTPDTEVTMVGFNLEE